MQEKYSFIQGHICTNIIILVSLFSKYALSSVHFALYSITFDGIFYGFKFNAYVVSPWFWSQFLAFIFLHCKYLKEIDK